jgi:hypothetical protein
VPAPVQAVAAGRPVRLAWENEDHQPLGIRRALGLRQHVRAFRARKVFPASEPGPHNGAVTDGQVGAVCPQCGSTAAVHSIEELAALAKSRLGQQPGSAAPQPGWAAEPQTGPVPGWAAEPQAGPLPGPLPGQGQGQGQGQGPQQGYSGQPRSGRMPGPWPGRFPGGFSGDGSSVEDDIAGVAVTAAAKFIGRSIGRRVQRAYEDRVVPALAAKQQALLSTQIAIAERHPDLRACLTDHVIFLAGGSRVLPIPNLAGLTVEQSDALVAQLRNG